jgi:CRISPR-associated protein Cas2
MADPMWLLLMFDLPVRTKKQRRDATRYRNTLLDLGFSQVQLSVYCKYLINATGVRTLLPILRSNIPDGGSVRILRLTDTQWYSAYRYNGTQQIPNQRAVQQLLLIEE